MKKIDNSGIDSGIVFVDIVWSTVLIFPVHYEENAGG